MRISVVLTVIGDDKPGIVEQLAERVLATGANWEESRMARLAGKFAGLLRVSVEADQADALATELRALEAGGLRVIVERSGPGEDPVRHAIRLELLGNDRPGIVRDISRVLAQHQVNIEDLETDVRSAPMSGDALFHAQASLRVPQGLSTDRLREVLEALAGELMVDLTLGEIQKRDD
jgi:glycine cleavage system regulatory protein